MFDPIKFIDEMGGIHVKPSEIKIKWRPAVYAVVLIGKWILTVTPDWTDQLVLPGGRVEPGGTKIMSLVKECLSEICFLIKPTSRVPFYESDEYFFCLQDGQYYHSLISIYTARIIEDFRKFPSPALKTGIKRIGMYQHMALKKEQCHRIFWPAIDYLKHWISIKNFLGVDAGEF